MGWISWRWPSFVRILFCSRCFWFLSISSGWLLITAFFRWWLFVLVGSSVFAYTWFDVWIKECFKFVRRLPNFTLAFFLSAATVASAAIVIRIIVAALLIFRLLLCQLFFLFTLNALFVFANQLFQFRIRCVYVFVVIKKWVTVAVERYFCFRIVVFVFCWMWKSFFRCWCWSFCFWCDGRLLGQFRNWCGRITNCSSG